MWGRPFSFRLRRHAPSVPAAFGAVGPTPPPPGGATPDPDLDLTALDYLDLARQMAT